MYHEGFLAYQTDPRVNGFGLFAICHIPFTIQHLPFMALL